MTPDKETIKQVVALYKQWYSQQSDKPLVDYVQEHWQEKDAAEVGDPEQDLDSIIKDLKIIIKKLKS